MSTRWQSKSNVADDTSIFQYAEGFREDEVLFSFYDDKIPFERKTLSVALFSICFMHNYAPIVGRPTTRPGSNQR